MIAVAELLNKDRLPGNYFAPTAYVQGDFELGLIENRQGNRLIALPNTMLEALHSSLVDEVGPSAGLVLFQCGRWWGKYFYRRFAEEVSTHYGKSLAEMEMVEFLQCLKQCWKTYGWGVLDLEFNYYAQGFIVATVQHSAFAQVQDAAEQPSCHTEAGLLSAFFSQLTGQDLHCVQTACESMGATENTFILGLAERLKVAEEAVAKNQAHDLIMLQLGLSQAEEASEGSLLSDEPESLMSAEGLLSTEPAEEDAVVDAPAEVSEVSAPEAEVEDIASPQAESLPEISEVNVEEPVAIATDAPEMSESEAPEEALSLESLDALEALADLPDLEETEASDAPEMPESEASEEALSPESLDALEALADLPDLEGFDELENLAG